MKSIYQAGVLLVVMTVLSGVVYPGIVTGIGQLLWADKSNGSLIKNGDEIVGSTLIAQEFKKPEYFWPRPSASNFNAMPSGASNLGPTSATLAKSIGSRRSELAKAHDVAETDIPMDLLTASASGLDPHISLESAKLQINRIIEARRLNEEAKAKIEKLIDAHVENQQLGILGEERLNVLMLNLALDGL